MESVRQIIENQLLEQDINEGMNDTSSNTHYAIHKPTGKIVFSWDYTGYDPEDLKLYKNDYFTSDIKDMEMNPKEITIWTRRTCINKGIDPSDDNNWSNYPLNEAFYRGRFNTTDVKEVEVNLSDVTFQEPLDSWITENFDELPSDSVQVELGYSATAYTPAGDLPSQGGDVNVEEISVDINGLFEEALGEYYPMFIEDIKNYVMDNMDYYDNDFEIEEPEREYYNEER